MEMDGSREWPKKQEDLADWRGFVSAEVGNRRMIDKENRACL